MHLTGLLIAALGMNASMASGFSLGDLLRRTIRGGVGAFGGVVGEIPMSEAEAIRLSLEEAAAQTRAISVTGTESVDMPVASQTNPKTVQTTKIETIETLAEVSPTELPSTTTETTTTQYTTVFVTVTRTLSIDGAVPT